jgi:hypothetical protein
MGYGLHHLRLNNIDVKFSKNINIFKNSLDSIPKCVEQFYGVD